MLFIVGDDVGYGDIGHFSDKKTITPTLDGLLTDGVMLTDYYTFKICSPSRARPPAPPRGTAASSAGRMPHTLQRASLGHCADAARCTGRPR